MKTEHAADKAQGEWTTTVEESGIVSVWAGEECVILAMRDDPQERDRVRNELNRLCDKHNTTLTAERENYALALQMKNIETTRANEAEEQLAAEREKRENSDRKWIVAAGQLRDQLQKIRNYESKFTTPRSKR
jgi:hypothetical protein